MKVKIPNENKITYTRYGRYYWRVLEGSQHFVYEVPPYNDAGPLKVPKFNFDWAWPLDGTILAVILSVIVVLSVTHIFAPFGIPIGVSCLVAWIVLEIREYLEWRSTYKGSGPGII